ncbi:tandem-95 repeat protein [Cellulomonas telluris]|uniref:tandem-95 repeat protein n=1 Tax=Cellulomonas telluris TaxID=2306636 RepID=UPI0010A7C5CF|nr:tandem-95 repeat protein [Cellulomonas telluris]
MRSLLPQALRARTRPAGDAGARHRGAPDRRWQALAAVTAVLTVAVAAVGVTRPDAAAAAGTGTVLLTDDFRSATTVASSYVVGGTNFTPCLTAGTSVTSTPVPGCAGTPDPNGQGALRLTANLNNQAGFLLYDKALPTKAGLDITFNQYQWGGTLADGITFFLTDGRYTLSRAGAFGGSLGYHHQATGADGVAHALLGIGLDVYGNYTVETNDTARCTSAHVSRTLVKNSVAVRGPGNGKSGYCLLGPAVPTSKLNQRGDGRTRPAPVQVRIVVDPPTTTPDPKVAVYLDGDLITSVDQPAELAATPTFKFGWGASTGGQNDFHEINFLQVESVDPIRSDLALTASTTAVASGDTATVALTARTDAASGPVPAGEPVVLTSDAPAGTAYGTPSGTGWDCSASTPTRVSCARTSTTAVDPGTTLPTVTVPLTRTSVGSSGRSTVTATVTAASDDTTLAADNTASAEVRWNPVVSAVEAPATVASATPAPAMVDPVVVGTAPFTVEVVQDQTPTVGTVAVVDGRLVLQPVAGASGDLRSTYRVTDAAGGVSNTATVSMRVSPVAAAGTATTTAGRTASVALDAPAGSGPFTAEVVARGAHLSAASVSVDDAGRPVVVATPAAGWSGTETVTYRVLDRTGVPSAPATVTVVVRPVAGDTTAEGFLDADGRATVTTTLPAGTGTGPFTYALVGDGDLGGAHATVTPSGELTVVADHGVSGSRTVRYTVGDGTSTSDEASVVVTVRPYLGPVAPVAGTTDAPLTADAPTLHGTGPVTWESTGPAGTAVTVAADGAVTLDPRGRSGTFDVALLARDADGQPSATQVVRFVVDPVAVAVDGEATASATPTATVLTPAAPTGTGPFTLSVAAGLPAALGTVAVDAAGTGLEVTPAPGVSGTLSATYVVTDASGLTSEPVRVELRVRPVVDGASARVPSGARTEVPLPAPTGTGPFTWTVTSAGPTEAGTVEVVDGVAIIRASAAYSGPCEVRYTVTDGSGLVSAEAVLAVTVDPTAPDEGAPGTAQQPGTAGSPVAGPTPHPSGTGPFRFTIVTPPAPEQGTATIDPDTGVVTFVPAPGFSGEADVVYAATDANGVTSDPATVTFRISPLAAPKGDTSPGSPGRPATTRAGVPTTVRLPAPVGTAPFTYELVDGPAPGQGTVTLDPRTGELAFVPARGFSGKVTVRYRVVDAQGLASAPQTVRIDVAPAVASAPATGTVAPGESTTVTLPTPVGRGPFTWTLVDGPSPDQGSVTLDPATGRLTFVAARGYTGTVRFTYTVTDADGVRSEVLSAGIEVRAALAVTGAGLLAPVGLALLLLAGGTVAVLSVRRRRA